MADAATITAANNMNLQRRERGWFDEDTSDDDIADIVKSGDIVLLATLWCDAPRRNSRRGASCHTSAAPPRYSFVGVSVFGVFSTLSASLAKTKSLPSALAWQAMHDATLPASGLVSWPFITAPVSVKRR